MMCSAWRDVQSWLKLSINIEWVLSERICMNKFIRLDFRLSCNDNKPSDSLPSVMLQIPFRFKINRTALLCTCSNIFWCFFRCGSQTSAAYSRIGRHRDLKATSLTFWGALYRLLLSIPNIDKALLVILLIWVSQLKLLDISTPKYRNESVVWIGVPSRNYFKTIIIKRC